jgi:2-polyprenyl-3-methyl-5-hydroxy-6-metoxy-1,4-benzoquinol methylase
MSCVICSSETVLAFKSKLALAVGSDCSLHKAHLEIKQCTQCSHIQKKLDSSYRNSANKIFDEFNIYELSEGLEQVKFQDKIPKTRSSILINNVKDSLPQSGSLLDVGTGNGAFLQAFSDQFSDWDLFGYDLNENFKNRVTNISGVRDFFCGELENIENRFDLISAIMVLEHIESPGAFLKKLKSLLKKDGVLLIQVPDLGQNIYDLVVFDHVSHFNRENVVTFSRKLFEHVCLPENQIPKEITLLLSQSSGFSRELKIASEELSCGSVNFQGFENILEEIMSIDKKTAVFGTSPIGTFFGGLLGDNLAFFVDEDVSKIGKQHLNKKILHPNEVELNSTILLPFPPSQAMEIQKRLPSLKFIVPIS